MAVSNWQKFVLLLWKNWLLQWNHKWQLAFEVILPVFFAVLLVAVRGLIKVELKPDHLYSPFSISDLDVLKTVLSTKDPSKSPIYQLPYSPTNPYLDNIIKNAVDSLQLEGYQGFANSRDLEKELTSAKYLAGIQFDDNFANLTSYPEKLSYTVRFPSTLRLAVNSFANTWETGRLFPDNPIPGPRIPDDNDGGSPVGYLMEGFTPIQQAISTSFLKLAANIPTVPEIVMERYPYPSYLDDPLVEAMAGLMALILILSFIYPCTYITKNIAHEKEKQLKEVMKIMGLQNWIHWTAWFLKSFVSLAISAILILIVIKVEFSKDAAVLSNSSWSAVLLFFLVYIIASICFAFMMAVFFSKASTAAAVTGLVWFVAYIPYSFLDASYSDLSLGQKLGWCLISNTAMPLGVKVILGFEGTGEGLQWSNLFTPVNVDDNLTLGAVMLMMLASAAIYMIICLYIEQIFPGEYGVPKKFYFPFTRQFWCNTNDYNDYDINANGGFERRNPDAFENEPKDKNVGIQVKDLKKNFGDKWAVKGVSLNMYEDEITVLLGHNGAGKTTTVSMLTGMFPPTSGSAIINGCDIRTNIDGARLSMGICPQYNVLFDDMSVSNHIVFFSKLKGLKGDEVQEEVKKYLKMIDLEDKADTASSSLSGGMKRKLSVCCALCGGTKVVLCDEPSSGMDPAARRQLWDLLQAEKVGRTVLLTTHFMDEADVLADRIAIMCGGELKCLGSSFFLKKKYGSGYKLICVKRQNCKVSEVTELLQKYIPGIQPKSDIGAELAYELPDNFAPIFEKMFGDLEKNSDELYLNGYGVGNTSLEEVFMKVGAESSGESPDLSATPITNGYHHDTESAYSDNLFSKDPVRLDGTQLVLYQWHAMFLKKMLCTWRSKLLLLIQNLLPIVLIAMTMFIAGNTVTKTLPPMTVGLTQYPEAVTVLEVTSNVTADSLEYKIGAEYESLVKSYGRGYSIESTGSKTFIDYILNLGKTIQVRINSQYLAAATVSAGRIVTWLNNQPLHTAPMTLNLIHNAMAKVLIGPNAEISVTNFPLPYSTEDRLEQLLGLNSLGIQVSGNVGFCMAFVTSFYILFLIKENVSRSKLLQFVTGVRVWTFWLTQFLWDFATFMITALILIFTLACFQEDGYSSFADLSRNFLLLIVFGIEVLPLTYIISFFFTEPSTGFARISIINIFTVVLVIVVSALSMPIVDSKNTADILAGIFRIFPHFALSLGMNKLFLNSATREVCATSSIADMPTEQRCKAVPQCCTTTPYFAWEDPGVLPEIIYSLIVAAICFAFVILNEYHVFSPIMAKLRTCFRKKSLELPIKENVDDDVHAEDKRIQAMSKAEIENQYLVLDRVTKYYNNFLAVNQISLCVQETECFGLLGVNGAGKTTTFKMMTGDENITSGEAYVKGFSLLTDVNAVYREIGYCPQFDALLEDLTGRETLRIFCLLRGIPKDRIDYISVELAKAFGFMKHIDKPTKAYSGGNKRKLSTALAVVGSPSVVYLDEPTSGMDPAARRQLWNMVCRVRDAGRSIILTSHSMEECEALCTRLAIMVNGDFKCIGSTQHLKNKFSKGLVLKMKLKRKRKSIFERLSSLDNGNNRAYGRPLSIISSELQTEIERIKDCITSQYPQAILQEEYEGMLTFYVPLVGTKWSEIFGFMERNRIELNIEDYSITQTTLEEIFLEFAKLQHEDPRSFK